MRTPTSAQATLARALSLVLLVCGCAKKNAAPGGTGTVDPLTWAIERPTPPRTLEVPKDSQLNLGPVALTLRGLVVSQQVAGDGVALTTAEAFLKVTLSLLTTAPATLDVSDSALVSGSARYGIARDAQMVAGGSPYSFGLTVGSQQPLVLIYEVPRAALQPGLKLAVPVDGGSAELLLQ
jgi:hypothetical protein